MKERADKLVAERGLAESREKARALIMAGLVYAGQERIEKPGQMLDEDRAIELKASLPFVSRAGVKLDEALEVFRVDVSGKTAADLGASTGGFTDCLLKRGARKVYAVDVDTRQIDWSLRKDPRVVLVEKNARFLDEGDFDEEPELVTMDLAFISVLKVLPAVKRILSGGPLLALIKPQFEVGRGLVGKKGVVRDPALHEEVLRRVIEGAAVLGFRTKGLMRPSVRGQRGNQEFFVLWSAEGPGLSSRALEKALRKAVPDG